MINRRYYCLMLEKCSVTIPIAAIKLFQKDLVLFLLMKKKTTRLIDRILMTSVKLSSVSASALLKADAIQVSKSSICDLLKKMPVHVDKSSVINICVDDFAFRKRYSYGTVMVNLDTHRIIDIIDSRETKKVEEWLKSYPNLKVISRDGAQTYSSAASNAHPDAVQVSDRFHLLKNLCTACSRQG